MVEGKVLICLPQYAGNCMAANMRSVIDLVRYLERIGYPYDVMFASDSGVHRVRYGMTEYFMRGDSEVLFFIDSDIEFTVEDFDRVLGLLLGPHGASVAVGCYRLKREGSELAAHTGGRLMALGDLGGGVIEVDYAGTGFMAIKRGTFEAIADSLPMIETESYGKQRRWWSFDVVDGVELPEDYGFCERVRAAGGRVLMDTGVVLRHWGLKGY